MVKYLIIIFLLSGCPNKSQKQVPLKKTTVEEPIIESLTVKKPSVKKLHEMKEYVFKTGRNEELFDLKNVTTNKLQINSTYTVSAKKNYFDSISLQNIILKDFDNNALKISSINSKVFLKNIKIEQSDKVLETKGGAKSISLVTDFRFPKIGMTHTIEPLKVKYVRASFLYMQNPNSYHIKSIKSDSAFYNKDGTNARINKSGVTLMKWKHYGALNNRFFKVDTIQFKNTNPSLELLDKEGNVTNKYRNLWRVENVPFLQIGYAEFDAPFSISGDSILIKKLIVSNKFKGHRANIENAIIDTLILKNTWFSLKNSTYKVLILDDNTDFRLDGKIINPRKK